jgi:hypothetical protein
VVRGPDATSRKVRRYRVQGIGDQAWNIARLHRMSIRIVFERQGMTKKSRVGTAEGAVER